jgi:hypothetical protein
VIHSCGTSTTVVSVIVYVRLGHGRFVVVRYLTKMRMSVFSILVFLDSRNPFISSILVGLWPAQVCRLHLVDYGLLYQLFKCDSSSPCYPECDAITRPYNESARHHQYPSRVTCSIHVTGCLPHFLYPLVIPPPMYYFIPNLCTCNFRWLDAESLLESQH